MSTPTARQLKEAAGLGRRKNREAMGCFAVEGWRSVASAIQAGATIEHVFLSPGLELTSAQRADLQRTTRVFDISEREMKRLSDVATPPGILAVVRYPDLAPLEPWPSRVLLLDGIQDPGNVGTLIRTAAWLGVQSVGIGPGTADPFQPKVVRSTMGGLWDVDIHLIDDLDEWLERAASAGASTWYTDMTGESVRDGHPSAPSIVVIGSEAHGVSDAVRRKANGAISIPGGAGNDRTRGVESLNAAVAGGIIMSHWMRSPGDTVY